MFTEVLSFSILDYYLFYIDPVDIYKLTYTYIQTTMRITQISWTYETYMNLKAGINLFIIYALWFTNLIKKSTAMSKNLGLNFYCIQNNKIDNNNYCYTVVILLTQKIKKIRLLRDSGHRKTFIDRLWLSPSGVRQLMQKNVICRY